MCSTVIWVYFRNRSFVIFGNLGKFLTKNVTSWNDSFWLYSRGCALWDVVRGWVRATSPERWRPAASTSNAATQPCWSNRKRLRVMTPRRGYDPPRPPWEGGVIRQNEQKEPRWRLFLWKDLQMWDFFCIFAPKLVQTSTVAIIYEHKHR